MAKIGRMLARTVLVQKGDIDEAHQILNRILSSEGILSEERKLRTFEKPCQKRNRLCFERGRRIYDSEMKRKIKFLMTKNRIDPFPR